jgi:hypothetical protein
MELSMSGGHVYVCFFRLCVFFTPETFCDPGATIVCFNSHMPLGLGMRAFLGALCVCLVCMFYPNSNLGAYGGHNSFFDSYMTLGLPGLSLGIVCMYMCYFYQKTWGGSWVHNCLLALLYKEGILCQESL